MPVADAVPASPHPYDAITVAELRERRSAKWRAVPPDVLPAWVAEMDFPLAGPVREALAAAVDRSDTGYVHPGGLAEAYAGFAHHRYGQQIDPGRTRVVPDVIQGIAAALELLTEPGDGVVIDTPVYPPFYWVIEKVGRRVVPASLARNGSGGFVADLEAIERAYAGGARAHLLCNPHNPTGHVPPRTELEAVAGLSERYGVAVVADEVHAPLTYDARYDAGAFSPFATVAPERCLTLVSASKAWNLPGLKCALLLAGSDRMWARAREMDEEIGYGASLFGAIAGEAAFREGLPWLDDTLAYLDGNRREFEQLLAAQLPGSCYLPPSATYLAWVDCRSVAGGVLGDDPAAVFCERGRVAVSRGLDFGPEGAGFVRVNLATPRPLLAEVVAGMAASL